MKYEVNYNTGVTKCVKGSLVDAMRAAEEFAAYTGESITILDEGNEVARLPWYGVKATEDDVVTCDFGDCGFYGEWIVNN